MIIARGLAPEGYGVYALVYSLFGMMTLTGDLGLAPATITQLAEALAARDREAAAEYCGYFIKLSALLGAALTVLGLGLGPLIADAVYGRPLIGLLAGLLMADMLLGLPRNLVRVAWQSSRWMAHLSVFEVARGAARTVAVAVAILLGWGVGGVVAAELFLALVSSLVAWPLFARLHRADPEGFPGWSPCLAQARSVPLKKHFSFGFKIILDRNVVRILEAIPFLILGRYAPAAQVGYLRLAWGVVNLPLSALSGLANNLAALLPPAAGPGPGGELLVGLLPLRPGRGADLAFRGGALHPSSPLADRAALWGRVSPGPALLLCPGPGRGPVRVLLRHRGASIGPCTGWAFWWRPT